jgi:hypothetical protein
MGYDAAHAQVVLFQASETWVWDGSDWGELHPAHSPPARFFTAMAYDTAAGQLVLFGGQGGNGLLNDTWTWDGMDWTEAHPVHSPSPRYGMAMAYDAVRRKVVLFGGSTERGALDGTWTWDGTDWTRRSPAHLPPRRAFGAMSSRNHVLLWVARQTWTWDGVDWTRHFPTHEPTARVRPGMTYDAATGQVVLFGGLFQRTDLYMYHGDTWTWDGTDWIRQTTGSISVSPSSGSPGAEVFLVGWGFAAGERVRVAFLDSVEGEISRRTLQADATGEFASQVRIPPNATLGKQHLQAVGQRSGDIATRLFRVT